MADAQASGPGQEALTKVLSRAIFDPGRVTPRGDNYEETLTSWQARAACIALLALPVSELMAATGMVPVGWTYPESASMYFCGGPRAETPKGMPLVYAEHDMAWRKEAHRGTTNGG